MADEQIKVSTAVDNTGFSTGLDSMKAQSAQFGESIQEEFGGIFSKIGSVGVAAAGAFVAAIDLIKEAVGEAFEKAEKFANLSERFAVGTTALQQLSNAAEQHGASIDDVSSAYNKLLVNSQKAIEGNKEMVDSFAALGVTVDDLKSKSLDDIMNEIADGTANASDKGAAYASVVQVLGKSAGNLFDTLKLGSAQIKQVGDASGVMSEHTIAALDGMEKSAKAFWGRFVALAGDGFVNFITGVETLYIVFQSEIQGMTEVAVAFGQLLSDIFKNPFRGANFSEFKERFEEAVTDAAQSAKDRLTTLANPVKGDSDSPSIRAARAGEDSAGEAKIKAAQKAQDEIDKINQEAATKEEKARYDGLTLDQKIAEQEKIIEEKSSPMNRYDDLQKAKARLAIATAMETLSELEKLKDEADKREMEKNQRKEQEKARHAEESAEKQVSADEEKLRKLEALDKKETRGFDDVRKIGGGLAGVNYSTNNANKSVEDQIDVLKKQLDLHKQEVTLLKQIANPDTSDDGSYTTS